MSPPSEKLGSPWRSAVVLLLMSGALFAASRANAQMQEQRMDEILHADRSKTSDFAGKTFTSSVSLGGKQAAVHAFASNRSAVLNSRDGTFRAQPFAGTDKFDARGFVTKTDRASNGDAFAQTNRNFVTKALPVQEAPGAEKSAAGVRDYLPGQKASGARGKRQDTIDEIHNQKELSIDEVREILNKPNGRPGTRPAVDTLPVLRALPVTAPSVR